MVPGTLVSLAKHFEGYSPEPYLCPAGHWTIGYGHLCPPDHPLISEAEAERLLMGDLEEAVDHALRLCPTLFAESDRRLSAIADFAFNLGPGRLRASTLRRRVNERNWMEAQREIRRWIYGGGRILLGLVLRREAEARLLNLQSWRGP